MSKPRIQMLQPRVKELPPRVQMVKRTSRTGRDADPRRTLKLNGAAWQRLRASVLAESPLCAHCLKRGGTMAVASLLPGFREDYYGRPPIRKTAGVGRIVAHRQNADGTYNILLCGMARIRITSELPTEASFREVTARQLFDCFPRGYDAGEGERTLLALVQKLSALLPQGGAALLGLTKMARTAGELTDVLSAALLSDPRMRTRMLHTVDVSLRVDLLSASLMRLISDLQQTPPSSRN